MQRIVSEEEWNKQWQDGFQAGLASRPPRSPGDPEDLEDENSDQS